MIKFFRKIRHNLINEGKTSKYLKYAAGEIILVVIGILIALSINTWNEERKERAIVKNVLKNIRYDLIADTVNFSSRIKRVPQILEGAKFLLNGTALDTSSANVLYDKMPYSTIDYKMNNKSYEKVITAAITDFFEFNVLFDDISTYYTLDSDNYNQLLRWDYDDTIADGKLWADMGFEIDIYEDTFYKANDINFAQPEDERKAKLLEQLKKPTVRNSIKMNMYRKMRLNEKLQDMKQKATTIILKIGEQLKE